MNLEKFKKNCWSDIESDSQKLVDTQKLVTPGHFWPFFNYPPSSGIAYCVGTAGMVMCSFGIVNIAGPFGTI